MTAGFAGQAAQLHRCCLTRMERQATQHRSPSSIEQHDEFHLRSWRSVSLRS
jgi:hypothetical protein